MTSFKLSSNLIDYFPDFSMEKKLKTIKFIILSKRGTILNNQPHSSQNYLVSLKTQKYVNLF